jgi:beta-lactamase class A
MQRRIFLSLGLGGLSAGCGVGCSKGRSVPGAVSTAVPRAREDGDAAAELAKLEREIGGRVGVFAFSQRHARVLSRRSQERFAMCSTFKWALAALVLHRSDSGSLDLGEELPFGPADVQEWSPVVGPLVSLGTMRIDALAEAAVTMSDNTATNLLLTRLGGPHAVTDFFRALGDDQTRLDRTEPTLNENAASDPRDTTTPESMARALARAVHTQFLSETSKNQLISWLEQTKTGLDRLRAGLPSSARAGDKTGTGNRGAVNDLAVVWPAEGDLWSIASYLSGSTAPLAQLVAAHQRIAEIASRALSG